MLRRSGGEKAGGGVQGRTRQRLVSFKRIQSREERTVSFCVVSNTLPTCGDEDECDTRVGDARCRQQDSIVVIRD